MLEPSAYPLWMVDPGKIARHLAVRSELIQQLGNDESLRDWRDRLLTAEVRTASDRAVEAVSGLADALGLPPSSWDALIDGSGYLREGWDTRGPGDGTRGPSQRHVPLRILYLGHRAEDAIAALRSAWAHSRPAMLATAESLLDSISPPRHRSEREPRTFNRWPFLRYDVLRWLDDELAAERRSAEGSAAPRVFRGPAQELAFAPTGDATADLAALRDLSVAVTEAIKAIKARTNPSVGSTGAELATCRRNARWLYQHWAHRVSANDIAVDAGMTTKGRGAQVRRAIQVARADLDVGRWAFPAREHSKFGLDLP